MAPFGGLGTRESRVERALWPAALRADHDHDLSPTLFGGVYSAMDSLAAAGVLASEQSSAAEREAAYVSIESCLRAAAEGGGDDTRLAAVELAVACSEPLASSVLCAPSSRVGAVEWRRASLLLVEMAKLDPIAVCGKTIRRNDEGSKPVFAVWTASGTAFAEMLAKGKDEWDLDDAVTAAVNAAWWVCFYQVGASAVLGPIGEGYEMEILGEFLAAVPYWGTSNDRFVPLALLCVDLLREPAGQPEAVLAGAWKVVCMVAVGRPLNGRAIWEAGVVGVMQTALRQYTPIERVSISEGQLVPTGLFIGIKDVLEYAEYAGVDVIPALLDAGAVDIAISTLAAYQELGQPDDASVCVVTYGALNILENLNLSSAQAKPIVSKLRSAGVGIFRYLLVRLF
jgi:hypothetical protein